MKRILNSVNRIFRTLDFGDDYQKQLGWSLWKLRCSLLFGLAPFDDERLGLQEQARRVAAMAARLPAARESTDQLECQLQWLLDHPENPKLEWLLSRNWVDDEPAAIFALMAMRTTFGADLIGQRSDLPANSPEVIASLDLMETGEHSALVVPGTCRYLSHSLFMKLFQLGEYASIHVLLYEAEHFSPKERLRLPGSPLLPQAPAVPNLNIIVSPDVIDESGDDRDDRDEVIPDQFFSTAGGGDVDEGGGVPSRYVLCDDGKGFFVAEGRQIRVWRENGPESLVPLFPAQLLEGDFVILEKSDRSWLLDHSGQQADFEARLDSSGIWREPLRALLLTRSLDEVVELMAGTGHIPERAAGLNAENNVDAGVLESGLAAFVEFGRTHLNLKSIVNNWAEGSTYGPKDAPHMLALVEVLVEEGALKLDVQPEEVAREWFENLERLRAGRRSAGRDLTGEIDRMLEDSLEKFTLLADGQEVELGNGMIVSLRQLSMIGDHIRRVPESALGKPV